MKHHRQQKGSTLVEQAAALALVTLSIIGFYQMKTKNTQAESLDLIARNTARLQVVFARALDRYISVKGLSQVSEIISFQTLVDEGYLDASFGKGKGVSPLGQIYTGVVGEKDGIRISYGVIPRGEVSSVYRNHFNLQTDVQKEALMSRIAAYIMEYDQENRLTPLVKKPNHQVRFYGGRDEDELSDYFPNHNFSAYEAYSAPAFFVLQKSPGFLVFNYTVTSSDSSDTNAPYETSITPTGYSSFCPLNGYIPVLSSVEDYWNIRTPNLRYFDSHHQKGQYRDTGYYRHGWESSRTVTFQFCLPCSKAEYEAMSLKPRYSAGTWRRYGLVVRIPGTVNGRARYDHTGELTFAISDRKYTIFYYNTSHIFEWSHSLLQWFGIVNGDVMEKNSSRTIFMYKSQQEHESMWGPLPFISHQEVLL